mmetsp:Transcript_65748/g.156990  ORF Transcript_65748/g.156990 Transcript_65748/m.156990 type:complete len:234 (+) Transcript_65748:205-906(+)
MRRRAFWHACAARQRGWPQRAPKTSLCCTPSSKHAAAQNPRPLRRIPYLQLILYRRGNAPRPIPYSGGSVLRPILYRGGRRLGGGARLPGGIRAGTNRTEQPRRYHLDAPRRPSRPHPPPTPIGHGAGHADDAAGHAGRRIGHEGREAGHGGGHEDGIGHVTGGGGHVTGHADGHAVGHAGRSGHAEKGRGHVTGDRSRALARGGISGTSTRAARAASTDGTGEAAGMDTSRS